MRERVAIAVIATAGLLLRVRGLLTDFWFDEIWSLRMAREARSPLDIFTRLTHDNNHPLNTLYMYALGPQPNWIAYRWLAFVCGVVTVGLLVRCATTPRERVAAAVFGALSLPMVVYGTEARGYAPAAMLAFLAYVWRKKPWPSAIAAALALLAHLSAIYIWIALLIRDLVRRDRPLAPHAIPAAVAAWLYFGFVRHLNIGGGPPSSKLAAAISAAAMAVGGTGAIAAAIAIVAVVIALVRDEDRLFFALAIFAVPAGVVAAHRGEFVTARYFFVTLPFVLLLFVRLAGRIPRAGALLLLAAWTIATAFTLVPFARYGRGTYRQALAFVRQGDVSGDNDFRNATMIDFYGGGRVRYHDEGDPEYARTPWFLIETTELMPKAHRSITTIGATYRLAGVFPYGGVSGWTWLVYRRIDPPSVTPRPAIQQ